MGAVIYYKRHLSQLNFRASFFRKCSDYEEIFLKVQTFYILVCFTTIFLNLLRNESTLSLLLKALQHDVEDGWGTLAPVVLPCTADAHSRGAGLHFNMTEGCLLGWLSQHQQSEGDTRSRFVCRSM